MAGLAESLFPRSSKLGHLSGYHPRALLGAGLDVASLPGRAYASLGRMEDESYLDALGRTGPRYVVGQGEGDEMADAILRDPLTPAGFGVGAAIKGLRPILGLGADLGTNAAGMAADQYASTGGVNGAEIGAGAGMGALLGLGGMAMGGKRAMISPEEGVAPRASSAQAAITTPSQYAFMYSDILYEIKSAKKALKKAERNGGDTGPIEDLIELKEKDLHDLIHKASPQYDTYSGYDFELAVQKAMNDNAYPYYGIRVNSKNPNTGEEYAVSVGENARPSFYNDGGMSSGESHGTSAIMIDEDNRLDPISLVDPYIGLGNETVLLGSSSYEHGLDAGEIQMDNPVILAILREKKSATGNRGTFDPKITHFAGAPSAPSSNRATTRLERQAAQVAYDKFGRPREESAERPVSTFQGLGSLLSSPSDTYYTRGGR